MFDFNVRFFFIMDLLPELKHNYSTIAALVKKKFLQRATIFGIIFSNLSWTAIKRPVNKL